MALLQNFTVSRNNDEDLPVTILTDLTSDTLSGATVEWSVYEMVYGAPLASPVLIAYSSITTGITILDSPPMTFVINLSRGDTAALDLGNYYHEATVIDAGGGRSTVMYGAMAVTLTLES